MDVIEPTHKDIGEIIKLIESDKKHLIPRNKREISRKIHFWRVIKQNDEIVACGCFDAYSSRMAEIRSFIVREDQRGKGFAKELLGELLKFGRPNQKVFVVTSVPEFFQKNDFDTCLGEKYILFHKNKSSIHSQNTK